MPPSLCATGDGRKVYRRDLCRRCWRTAPHREYGAGLVDAPWRVPAWLPAAVREAAAAKGVSPAEWARAVLVEALRAGL